ncbi:MAG TPA: hypothetical protein VHZ03_21325 [Trebonia sp.]|jgi:hypothetical protein|nr:hypothetical protein [Trebonia sp.]
MTLTGVLLTLFMVGCWLYCLSDAALTPAVAFRGLSKRTWIAVIAATFTLGAIAWLLAQSRCRRPWAWVTPAGWSAADASQARHPAGRYREADVRARIKGPDDDPEFLRDLARIIRDSRD